MLINFRNPTTGGWRAIKLSDGVLHPPDTSGWGDTTYIVVMGGTTKNENPESNPGFGGYAITSVPSVGGYYIEYFTYTVSYCLIVICFIALMTPTVLSCRL